MSQGNKVMCVIPQTNGTAPGDVIALYPEDTQPFGAQHLTSVKRAMAGTQTGTTNTLSITLGPDSDTDPADTDMD